VLDKCFGLWYVIDGTGLYYIRPMVLVLESDEEGSDEDEGESVGDGAVASPCPGHKRVLYAASDLCNKIDMKPVLSLQQVRQASSSITFASSPGSRPRARTARPRSRCMLKSASSWPTTASRPPLPG